MLTRGNCSRTQHPTDANATSSRSHAIFQVSSIMRSAEGSDVYPAPSLLPPAPQIFVKQQDRVPGLTQALRVAKMSLIDLAGSERASSTHAKGERLREGANINRSLLALINVLNALADAKVLRCSPSKGRRENEHLNPAVLPSRTGQSNPAMRLLPPGPQVSCTLPRQQTDPLAQGLPRGQLPHCDDCCRQPFQPDLRGHLQHPQIC